MNSYVICNNGTVKNFIRLSKNHIRSWRNNCTRKNIVYKHVLFAVLDYLKVSCNCEIILILYFGAPCKFSAYMEC